MSRLDLLRRRSLRYVVLNVMGFVAICMILAVPFFFMSSKTLGDDPSAVSNANAVSKAIVVASVEEDNISWLDEHFSDWNINRFIVNNASAELTVPKNKGREAMVYLTYVINTYDNLPDVMVFIHSSRYQWHNDDPLYGNHHCSTSQHWIADMSSDGIPMLKNLQLPYIISQGYANLRCVWTLGWLSKLKLNEESNSDPEEVKSKPTQNAYPQAFQELFPGEPVPPAVGVACCAQFAVTREKIRERSLGEYQRYRGWLLDTPLEDNVSGRVLEYAWHIIFGKPHVHCSNAKDCYCNTFGLCNLECEGEERCGERWPYPPSSTLPQGWPTVGWDMESRDQDVLENLRNAAIASAQGAMKV
ncbi:MAG: hypothetical protein M1818_001954 [Claussenomyces sp. TS43310]|nr:MAG: hypothetical protein M1818_001954 [Claussenomyces sp. TS43310]